jgi:hypothetical protein
VKKIALLSIALLSCLVALAQTTKEADVPAAVKQSFGKAFPQATKVKWSKENEQEFEAEFESEGKEMSANFNMAGTWTGTETAIKKSDLPKDILGTIARDFVGYKIEEAERAEAPDKPVSYEVELEKGNTTYEVQFSVDGKVIRKMTKKGTTD